MSDTTNFDPAYLASYLQDQIRAAVATGLPWMIDNAKQAYRNATDAGLQLPFDEKGNDLPGAPAPQPLPQQVTGPTASTAAAIGAAQDQGVYTPPAATPPTGAPGAPDSGASGPATPALEDDPAYQAFVRALGSQRATAENNTNTSIDAANRSLALRLPQISDAGDVARERISGGYETRGLFNSGQHEQALARQRQSEGAQSAAAQDTTAQRIADLHATLAGQETGFDTSLAEQRLNASGRLQEQQAAAARDAGYQSSVADLLAAQQRSTDALNARYDAAIANQGPNPNGTPTYSAPSTPISSVGAQVATAANPIGIVAPGGAVKAASVPDPSDPDYVTKLLAMKG